MTRELDKIIAQRILIYQANLKMANNGIMPKNKAELVSGLLMYLLDNVIENKQDIPKKYQEIFTD